MDEINERTEAIAQLERLRDEAGDLIEPCLYKSSFTLFGDLRAKARRQQDLYHYVLATFFQMDQAQYLLDFQTTRERAIELISLLESEEQARKIQSDFQLPIYETLVYQMSSCAYENLADATANLEGYNGEGMQACITEGLQICRQTGKLPCSGCFREYSCDVYTAADDAELASHQCTLVLEETRFSDRGDRRWLAKKTMAWIALLEGRVQAAVTMLEEALLLSEAEEVAVETEARIKILYDLDAARMLMGDTAELRNDPVWARHPPAAECPLFDLLDALNEALGDTLVGNYDSAAKTLAVWDRRLQECKAKHLWFEVRLRLIAVKLLQGDEKQADRLANQLEKQASEASDWLTQRRLTALQDPDFPTSPLALYGKLTLHELNAGGSASEPEVLENAADSKSEDQPKEKTPLEDELRELANRMTQVREGFEAEDIAQIRAELMAIDDDRATHRDDTCMMMHIMNFLIGDCEDTEEIWIWANHQAARFKDDGTAISILAATGNQIRLGSSEFGKTITTERLEPLVRKSLQLDSTRPRTFMRAGDHFAVEENYGEAERCYARAFRLCRDGGDVALRLAKLYLTIDRERDALHVLDVCLRTGAEEPEVAWEAVLTAFSLGRYEAMLTYLDRFENMVGTMPWANYYRSIGLLEQGDVDEALAAIQRESQLSDDGFHVLITLGCCKALKQIPTEAEASIRAALAKPLREIDYLIPSSIASLLTRLADRLTSNGCTGTYRPASATAVGIGNGA